jgi:hypothetical protein
VTVTSVLSAGLGRRGLFDDDHDDDDHGLRSRVVGGSGRRG